MCPPQYVDYANGCQRYSKNSTAWYTQFIADHQPLRITGRQEDEKVTML